MTLEYSQEMTGERAAYTDDNIKKVRAGLEPHCCTYKHCVCYAFLCSCIKERGKLL